MTDLIPPHGGKLIPLLLNGEVRDKSINEARTLPRVRLDSKVG